MAKGATVLAVGVILGAALVGAAAGRLPLEAVGPVLAAGVAVLLYLVRGDDPSVGPRS